MEAFIHFSPTQLLGLIWLNNVVRYMLIAGLAYLFFWRWGSKNVHGQFLYHQRPGRADVRRELMFSFLSTGVFLVPTCLILWLKNLQLNRVYYSLGEHSLWWYALSFVVVFLVHDTYFYWTHRLMHHRALYPVFHRIHHLSRKPTPLAAFSFHPAEALVEAGVFLFISIIIPVHFSVLLLFNLFSLLMNVYGHLGFSLFAEERLKVFPLNLFSHPCTHAWHHQNHNGNYGFYLTLWDKWMGTYEGSVKRQSLIKSE